MDNILIKLKEKINPLSTFFKKYEKAYLLLVFGLFIYLTIVGIAVHEPWLDEAQAWLIAQDLNFFELLNQMKYEGHLFLWFLVLMPSAKLNLAYPMPMLITNVIFIWGVAYLLLVKSPFHPLLKTGILFSMPIAYQYGIIARPYAMGVFFLLMLTMLYRDKLKRPILYAVLIFLCANTNSLALCGATAFGLIFLYEYIKEKKTFWQTKEFYILAGIALFCALIIGYQWIGAGNQVDKFSQLYLYTTDKLKFFFQILNVGFTGKYVENRALLYLLPILILSFSLLTFWKDKKTLFFFSFTYTTLYIIFLNLYNGYHWHYYMFFVYLIISLWLYKNNNEKNDSKYRFVVMAIIYSSLIYFIPSTYERYVNDYVYKLSNAQAFSYKLSKDDSLKNGTLVICDEGVTTTVPYLRRYGLNAYSCYSGKKNGFFDRRLAKNLFLNKDILTPKYFGRFEDKKIYLIFHDNSKTQIMSDYYRPILKYCSEPADSDWNAYCLIELEKGY